MHDRPLATRRTVAVRAMTTAAVAVGLLTVSATPAAAHERWFTGGAHPTSWSFAVQPLALLALAAAVLLTLAWRAVAARLRSPSCQCWTGSGGSAGSCPTSRACSVSTSE